MKLTIKTAQAVASSIVFSAGLVASFSAVAASLPAPLTMKDTAKDYLVAGIALHDASSPFMSNSVGYDLTLQVLKGSNECTASQKQFSINARDNSAFKKTEVELDTVDANLVACQENYKPVFGEVKSYIPTWSDYAVQVDTNTLELGTVSLLASSSGAIVHAVKVAQKAPVAGLQGWSSAEFEVSVLAGTNACEAAQKKLSGFVYSINGQVHLAVKTEATNASVVCPMMYAPVVQTLKFVGLFESNASNKMLVENFGERGVNKIQKLN